MFFSLISILKKTTVSYLIMPRGKWMTRRPAVVLFIKCIQYMTAPLSGDEFWLWWTFHLQKISMLAFWLWYVSMLLLAFSSLNQTKASQSCYLLSFFHWNCFYLLMMYYAVGPELHWNLVGWCVHVCIAGNTVAGYVLYVLCFDQSLLSFVTATKFISLLAAEIMI